MKTIKLKLNVDLQGRKAGDKVTVQADENGLPVDQYWRRRLRDAKIDNCVEVVKSSKAKREE